MAKYIPHLGDEKDNFRETIALYRVLLQARSLVSIIYSTIFSNLHHLTRKHSFQTIARWSPISQTSQNSWASYWCRATWRSFQRFPIIRRHFSYSWQIFRLTRSTYQFLSSCWLTRYPNTSVFRSTFERTAYDGVSVIEFYPRWFVSTWWQFFAHFDIYCRFFPLLLDIFQFLLSIAGSTNEKMIR